MKQIDDLTKTFTDILKDVRDVLKPGVAQADRTRMGDTIDRFINLLAAEEPEDTEEPGEPAEGTPDDSREDVAEGEIEPENM